MRDRVSSRLLPLLLPLLLASTPSPAGAADAGPRWIIAPYGGYALYDDHFGQLVLQNPAIEASDVFHVGGRIGYVTALGLGLELAGGWSPGTIQRTSGGAEKDMPFAYGTGNLVYSPLLGPAGGPFISAGFGLGRLSMDSADTTIAATFPGGEDTFTQGLLDMAAGWNFPIGGNLELRLEARNLLWLPSENTDKASLNYVLLGGALGYHFGGTPADADLDGVPDGKDKCPATPSGARVGPDGCPTDADGDGVFDGLDQCPDTPKGATVDARGCTSDSDGDGVLDGLDRCADTPKGATVDAGGCPTDADGDGVFDGLDRCPDTPKGVTVDPNGCTVDADGDGVPDGIDRCPNTPIGTKVDASGCPEQITQFETEMLDTGKIRIENVNFETAKATILPESDPILDNLGTLLSRWPELKIEIGGHTDARGSNAYNQRLSEQRASAVKDYLVSKFPDLKPDQYTVKGYGESKPVVPNDSATNMARNRRVEFSVLNREVLKREVERRKSEQK